MLTPSRNVFLAGVMPRAPLVEAFHRAFSAAGAAVVVAEHDMPPGIGTPVRTCRVATPDDPRYIDDLLAVVRQHEIGFVVPASEDELVHFARAANRFERERVRVVVSPSPTVAICLDAYQLGRVLTRRGIPAIECCLPDQLGDSPVFPVVVRPRFGRRADRSFFARDAADFRFFLNRVHSPVVEPHSEIAERMVHIVCDFAHSPVSIVPRHDAPREVAALIGHCTDSLPFVGAVSIGYRVIAGRPVVTRITPCLGEDFPLTVEAGTTVADLIAGFCLRSVRMVAGYE
jgi:hypothetical protein